MRRSIYSALLALFSLLSINSLAAFSKKEEPQNTESEQGCCSLFDTCEDKGCDHSWSSTVPVETDCSQAEVETPPEKPRKSAAQKSMEAEWELQNSCK